MLHCQALSDFCSDPNTFVLNSTQFNTGTSSGNVSVSNSSNYDGSILLYILPSYVLMVLCLRCAGLLLDLQPAHEQSVPAGNVT